MNSYPELDKMKAVHKESQAIGNFIEHLQKKGLQICQWQDYEDAPGYYIVRKSIVDLLADYYGIDMKKVHEEQALLLEEVRQLNK